MTRTLRYLLLFVLTGLSGSVFAQEIGGRILDEKKQPLASAGVMVYQGGILKGGAASDYDGNYAVKPLEPGYYDVLVLYSGYDSLMITGVVVSPGNRTTQNFQMKVHNSKELSAIVVKAYKKPLINQDNTSSVLTKEEIAVMPTTQVADLVATNSTVIQAQRGAGVNAGGARATGMLYIIDGVQVRNYGSSANTGIDMAQGSIEQIEVITSGIPANYGDVSGAVVNITSRGVAQKLTGDVRLQHSIDGYNNNLASFSIAGPLYKKKVKDGEVIRKKPVLGFALSGDYYDDHNRYPSYTNEYVTKSDVLKNLQQNPLRISTDNQGAPVYDYASNYITAKDIATVKGAPNNETKEERLNGKLDYQLTDNMRIAAGGTIDYVQQDIYSRARNLFAPEATPTQNTFTGRAYVRFTQKFGKSNDTTRSIISNAFYKVQADYQRLFTDVADPRFKKDIFNYAYIGKFYNKKSDVYLPAGNSQAFDSLTGKKGVVLFGKGALTTADGITFERSELNPNLANYTTQFFNSLQGLHPAFISTVQSNNGLANGDLPKYTYGMFLSPGATQSSYSNFSSDQYALSVDASFDLLAGKTKHAIEFGLYYQQRIERSYAVYANPAGSGTNSLWSLMRSLVSSYDNGNLKLDKLNPIFKVNGQPYTLDQVRNGVVLPGPTDTIIYNYKNVGTSTFDKRLRAKLGTDYTKDGATKDINIDELSPSTFSLDMFSADELLHSGNPYVSYYGYGYTGAAQTGTVNFNDFWTQKDKDGNYTRPIGAFSPNYIAGYVLDKFTYKDVHFNVGVRVDRYSANTKVLKDPFDEYAEKTVNQVSGANNTLNGGKHPGNMGSDYVVYVDNNNSSSPTIIGYRTGNTWYDPTGKFVSDPATLKQYSNGRTPEPFLVNPGMKVTDTNFNPNLSFTDYTPQVNVMPRISFSFPISDVADFYAHYDIYAQRPYPASLSIQTPYDFYFLNQLSQNIMPNSNLKPEKTYDYEVGFQQKLTDHSALTLTAFYKERKDMIGTVPYLYAWPISYYTYGNRDFSTTKGTTIVYDMRATNHLRLNLSYTLQFAEGSGSDPNAGNGGQAGRGLLGSLVEAGFPYLRYVSNMAWDSRHNLVGNIDYRFGDGEGPVVGGKNILQNAGVDFIAKARSGEPYTRYSDAVGNTVIGGINGSRLPWHYGVDMRIDKDFALAFGKKRKDAPDGVKPRRPMYLKAIFQANNLLNTQDVLHVYGYTGRPDDNGYLTSSFGQQFVPQQTNPQSYTDLYRIANNGSGNYNYARTFSIALEFNF